MTSCVTNRPARFAANSLLACLAAVLCTPNSLAAGDHWRQWGGPNADFKIDSPPLADTWPESGPPLLWQRDLGDGYSSIASDDGLLYTLYRKDDSEIVVALDAETGETKWTHKYEAKLPEKLYKDFGVGPRAMPMISEGRLYTVGINGTLLCLDKRSGKVIWSHELIRKLGGTPLSFGYSASPIAYKNTIIMEVGGKGQALVAFNAEDGAVVWKALDFMSSHATPLLIKVGGRDQLVCMMGEEVIGVDPNDGSLQWQVPQKNRWSINCTAAVWGPDNQLFASTEEFGSQMIKLTQDGGKTTASQTWFKRNPQVQYQNIIRLGDTLYGAAGIRVAPLTAIDAKTGEVRWRSREFKKPMVLHADGKLIVLGEDGTLGLAKVSPGGVEILAKHKLLQKRAWAVPTLVGTNLYVRDQKTVMAIELGRR
ncbi:MAG: PQQ-like beta-propeller repeat protein [Planctomycetes bacterium]|nr:PQQ-like beta-propeller repeat protein [Planctomycetota bacterium]